MYRVMKFRFFTLPSVCLIKAVLLLMEVLMFGEALAQNQGEIKTRVHYLGVHLNSGLYSYREDLLVPLGFHGPGFSLGAVYTYQSEKNRVHVRLRLGMGHMTNRYSHEAWGLFPELHSSWLRTLAEPHRWGGFWIGVCYHTRMNNLFIESWDDSHLYWLTSHSLGISVEWQKELSKKNGAVIRVESPVIGFVSRPPVYRYKKQEPLNHWTYHFTEPNRNLHIVTCDTYRALFLQMLFVRKIRSGQLNLGIEFQYAYYQKPEKIWGLNTSAVISYQWRIGS